MASNGRLLNQPPAYVLFFAGQRWAGLTSRRSIGSFQFITQVLSDDLIDTRLSMHMQNAIAR